MGCMSDESLVYFRDFIGPKKNTKPTSISLKYDFHLFIYFNYTSRISEPNRENISRINCPRKKNTNLYRFFREIVLKIIYTYVYCTKLYQCCWSGLGLLPSSQDPPGPIHVVDLRHNSFPLIRWRRL